MWEEMANTKGGSHSLIPNSWTNIQIISIYFKKMDQLRPGTVDSVRNAANSLAVSEFQPYSNSLKHLSVYIKVYISHLIMSKGGIKLILYSK